MLKPILQALVLADHVHVDRGTLKSYVLGTFNELRSPEFPSTMDQSTFAYISLTDVRGEVAILLRYVDLADNKCLMEAKGVTITGRDPLATIEFVVPIPPFPMPHEGTYAFEVYANDEMIGAKRLQVIKRERTQ